MNRVTAASFAALLVVSAAACGDDDGVNAAAVTSGDSAGQAPAPTGLQVNSAIVDAIVTSLQDSGAAVDRDCVAAAITDADLTELTSQAPAYDAEFVQTFIDCITP